MTHFHDGTPYTYFADEEGTTNVGWLDESHEYTRGEVSDDFVAALKELCKRPVNRTRGWHYCNLCLPEQHQRRVEDFVLTTIRSTGGDFPVGSAEVRAVGADGSVFAAPDMVIHYVLDHAYRPPDEFIEAVLLAVRHIP